jgi:3-hydroxyisobutyrate dehydrogenase-like beta-hydroxyacid dehydrogenase
MQVAFLGMGTMGRHMARNLVKAGHELTVWNRSPERAQPLLEIGARRAPTPREAAIGAKVMCLSLSTPDVVRDVVLRDDGLLAGASPGSVVVDFSTVDPETSRALASACSGNGVGFLDAPVSGGPEGAEAGTLTVMAGGEPTAFADAQPVLDAVGANIRHVGPTGAGIGIKLINQMLVGVNLAAVLEAWVMAKRAGIDVEMMFDVLKSSAGSSVMLTRNVPDFLMKEQYQPGFALRLLVKDLDLVVQMGKDVQVPLFTPAVALQLYRQAMAAGLGNLDMSATVMSMERQLDDLSENKAGR